MSAPSRGLWVTLFPGLFLAACNAIWGIDQPIASEGGPDGSSDRTVADAHDAGPDATRDARHDVQAKDSSSDVRREAAGDASLYFTGACADGGVITLASSQAGPHYIASDDAGVYWTTIDGLSILEFGSKTTFYPTEGGFTSEGVAANNGTVAWGAHDDVLACAVPGCPTLELLSSTTNDPIVVAKNATTVFWTAGGTGGVYSCPLSAGSPAVVTATAASGLALDGTYVYWSDGISTIYSCPLAGCTGPPALVVSATSPRDLLVHGGVLFWSTFNTIGTCLLHSGTCDPIGAGTFVGDIDPAGLAADEDHLYWVDESGFIGKVSLDGGAPEGGAAIGHVHDSTALSGSLSVGDTCVFWTELDSVETDGSVMAGPK
jgi:hypothetical protein